MQKALFLDRDGVLNIERGNYTYLVQDFELCPGVPEALLRAKIAGYKLIVITNQGGIAKNIYTIEQMHACHAKLQKLTNNLIDAFYYAPGHPEVSESLSRKPGSLLLEKAMAKYALQAEHCYMIGDQERDVQAAAALGIAAIKIGQPSTLAVHTCLNLAEAVDFVLREPATITL